MQACDQFIAPSVYFTREKETTAQHDFDFDNPEF